MMSNKKNILILTSKTGGGHISLAEALSDLLEGALEGDVQAEGNDHEKATKDTEAAAITIVDPQPGFFQWHYRVW